MKLFDRIQFSKSSEYSIQGDNLSLAESLVLLYLRCPSEDDLTFNLPQLMMCYGICVFG